MRIVGLNIQNGGGRRVDQLISTVEKYDSDVFVFGEYHAGRKGQRIKEKMKDIGFDYSVDGDIGQENENSVAIFSRIPFEIIKEERELGDWSHRLVEVNFEDFKLVGVYFPNGADKEPVFEYLIQYCEKNADAPVAITGDWNTCKDEDKEGGKIEHVDYLYKIEELGWIDGWRKLNPNKTDFSWYSNHKNGFRLDHLYCTESFSKRLAGVNFCHEPRESKITDHSALVIDSYCY